MMRPQSTLLSRKSLHLSPLDVTVTGTSLPLAVAVVAAVVVNLSCLFLSLSLKICAFASFFYGGESTVEMKSSDAQSLMNKG